jgi:superfamily I DNA and/or RNA helicase
MVWIDHSGFGMYEGDDNYPDQHESFYNKGEAELVANIYDHLRSKIGIPEDDIGIISCYWAQVAHIRESLETVNPDYTNATVRTIDGYQEQ